MEASILDAIRIYESAKREHEMLNGAISLTQADTPSSNDALKNRLAALLAHPGVRKSRNLLYTLAYAQMMASDLEHEKLTLDRYLELAAEECSPEIYRWAVSDVYYKLHEYEKLIPVAREALSAYPDGP